MPTISALESGRSKLLPPPNHTRWPIGSSAGLQVGSAVYAIGTPLQERFSRSVTKGVISALRPTKDGRTVIQSDVDRGPDVLGGWSNRCQRSRLEGRHCAGDDR